MITVIGTAVQGVEEDAKAGMKRCKQHLQVAMVDGGGINKKAGSSGTGHAT
jgi:hypothetical protein